MVGIAALSLSHIDNQVTLLIVANIFLQFLNNNTISLEVFNHIKGLLGIIVFVEPHRDDIIVREEFFLTVFHPSNNLAIRSDQLIFGFWIFNLVDATEIEVEAHFHELVRILGQVRDTSEDSVVASLVGFLIALRDFNGMT